MRRAARVDANQAQIVGYLRAQGASVYLIQLPVDLLVGLHGKTELAEIKDPHSRYGKQGLNRNQQSFVELWRGGPVHVLDSLSAAQGLIDRMGRAA